MKAREHIDHSVRRRAIEAALGRVPFDVLLTDGLVLDVSTGALRACDVGIVGALIASVHPRGARSDAVEVVDCTGRTIAPGFIDSHLHFEPSMATPSGFSRVLLPHGTTTVACDPHELANVSGVAGIRYAVDAVRGQPLRYIVQASSCVPAVPGVELSGADLTADDLADVLAWPEISGLGELMDYLGIFEGNERTRRILEVALDSGHTLNGHAAGLSGPELQAYLASGVSSDHNIYSLDDFRDRIESGMTVELVGMFMGAAITEIAGWLESRAMFPTNLVLATDDLLAVQYEDLGGVDAIVRALIAAGLAPEKAYRAATLNAAVRLRREDLGLVAPGRVADLLLLRDLSAVDIEGVMASGVMVARDGAMLADVVAEPVEPDRHSVVLPRFSPGDFALTVDTDAATVRVRTMIGLISTSWGEAEARVVDGALVVPDDHVLMSVVHRHGRRAATPTFALIGGRGQWTGAMATTVSHDSHNLVVFGRDPAAMAIAANAVVDLAGGYVIVEGTEVAASIALPFAGLMADTTVEETMRLQRQLRQAARSIGMAGDTLDPIFEFTVASLVAVPGPHLSDLGIVDGTTGEHFGARPLVL